MADDKVEQIVKETREQAQQSVDDKFGMGFDLDGKLNSFPLAELGERTAARDRDEQAMASALPDESAKGAHDAARSARIRAALDRMRRRG